MGAPDKYIKLVFNKDDDVEKFILQGENAKKRNELRTFYFFVNGCLKIGKPPFLFDMYQGESPDFKLCGTKSDFVIGLEHAKATNGKYEMDIDFVEGQKFPPSTIIEIPFYSDYPPPSKNSKIAIKMPGEKMTHGGWGDDGEEEAWSNTVLGIIAKKIDLLNELHFKKFSKNELLIDGTNLFYSSKGMHTSIDMLTKKHLAKTFDKPVLYDKYHIIMGNNLIYDVFGKKIITENKFNLM